MKNSISIIMLCRSLPLIIFFAFTLNAQSKVTVNVLSLSFNPSNITINEGDTVEWINNNQGNHNVNGTNGTYPSNPESFGNSISTNWTFSHKFNTPGSYNYRCDVHFSSGMTGTITVLPASEINETALSNFIIYPNPASTILSIKGNAFDKPINYSISTIEGNIVMTGILEDHIDISPIESGVYYVLLSDNKNRSVRKIVVI